jgi:hypothetical protein
MIDNKENKAFQNLINYYNTCDDLEKVQYLKEMLLNLN